MPNIFKAIESMPEVPLKVKLEARDKIREMVKLVR